MIFPTSEAKPSWQAWWSLRAADRSRVPTASFQFRSVVGKPDDYASMREVLTRRLERYEQHKQEGVGFGRLPDLILLDGGRGHVAAVKPLVRQMGFDIPIFGMAKDDRHRTRTIATEDGELSVSSFRAAFDLLTSIQDETSPLFHRLFPLQARQPCDGVGAALGGGNRGKTGKEPLPALSHPQGNGGCHCGAAGGNAGYDPPDCP